MKFGKKGMESEMWAADTILFWLIFGLVLGFVAIIFVTIISKSGVEKATIHQGLERLNLMQRFYKSPICFVYDREGIIIQDTIDFDKFNERILNSCYIWPEANKNTFPAFRIILNYDSATSSIKTSNWNENMPFEEKIISKDVTIYASEKFQKGEMEIEVQNII